MTGAGVISSIRLSAEETNDFVCTQSTNLKQKKLQFNSGKFGKKVKFDARLAQLISGSYGNLLMKTKGKHDPLQSWGASRTLD